MYFVYILSNERNTVLYIGVTNNLTRRGIEHKELSNPRSFTRKYNVTKLIYFEEFSDIKDALNAEKKLKGWKRIKKTKLVETINPTWRDLFTE